MASFVDIANATLRDFNLTPVPCSDPVQALALATTERAEGRYPVLVTTSDTSGEKEIEEFIARGEQDLPHPRGFSRLATITAPGRIELAPLRSLLAILDRAASAHDQSDIPSKTDIADALAAVVPGFPHRETGKSLDGKM